MTEQTQPTDAEILDAADDFRSQYKHGGTTFDEFNALGFARAVLAKWGTPAGAGEVVAWQSRCRPTWGNNHPWTSWELCTKGQAEDYQKTPLLHDWEYEVRALYTTPQPTQAQAGAPRVSPEQWQALFDDQKRLVEIANSRADIAESMLTAVQAQAGAVPLTVEPLNEKLVAGWLARHGLTLTKTNTGYEVLKLSQAQAHGIKGADHG